MASAVLCPWARHFTPRKYWLITQEAMAPSRYDWKIVDWDVKPQHNQPTIGWLCICGWRISLWRTKSTIMTWLILWFCMAYKLCLDFQDDPRKTRSGSMSRHSREVPDVGDLERTSSNEDLLKNLGPLPVCIQWACAWQNQQTDLCAQQRLGSAWASTQSDQSLHYPHEETFGS